MVKYHEVLDGEWITPKKKFKLACCDCGLVHNYVYRIKNGYIQFKAVRNKRSTAAIRRERKKRTNE